MWLRKGSSRSGHQHDKQIVADDAKKTEDNLVEVLKTHRVSTSTAGAGAACSSGISAATVSFSSAILPLSLLQLAVADEE